MIISHSMAPHRHQNRHQTDILAKYLHDVGKSPKFTKEEEHELAIKAQAGDKSAQDLIITSVLLLVVSLAKDMAQKYSFLNLEDLIQEGNVSLLEAFQKFDPNRGTRFSTFAFRKIKWKMQFCRLSFSSGVVNIPVEAMDEAIVLSKLKTRLRAELGFPPTDDELCQTGKLSKEKLKRIKCAEHKAISWNRGHKNQFTIRRRMSYVNPIRGYDSVQSTDDRLDGEFLQNLFLKAMSNLPFREQEIIKHLYGLNGSESLSHERVGQLFRISKQRVHQLDVLLLSYLYTDPQIRKVAATIVPGLNLHTVSC